MFATKLDAALAARLQFDVFPVVENTKVARIKDWPNRATRDEAQIREWWRLYPNDNIGGATNDMIVVDVDPRNGGKASFEMLALMEDFDKTARSHTAGGGDHIIYAAPEGRPVKGGTNKLGPGVDVKARGGYILLPGSTINGNAYEWGNERPIARAMPWLVERCKAVKPKTDSAGKRLVEEDEQAIDLATQWMLNKAPSAEYGAIDDTTYRVSVELFDYGVSLETATDIMLEWNEIKCSPPGDTDRLLVVVDSALRNRENAIGSKHPLASPFEAVEIDESLAPPLAPEAAALPKPKLYAIRADEAARTALESRGAPLIKGIIDQGTMSTLVGVGGGGKTFLALDWAYHIAKGIPWNGKKVDQGPVVYLAAEAGNMIRSRILALETRYGPLGDTPLYIIPCPANFSRGPEDLKAIMAMIREAETQSGQKLKMFVVDTLARVMTGDENSAKDMGVIIESVDYIRQQTGCHVMLIHHPNKSGTSARGSGNVFGAIDTEMWVEKKKLSFTKQRDLPMGKPIKFRLEILTLGKEPDGAPITSCVVKVPAAGEPEPKADLTPSLSEVWGLLRAALEDAGKTAFDMKFLRTIPFRQTSVNGLPRMTVHGWMTDLTDSGYLRKDVRGQWVVVDDGFDGIDENTNCHLTAVNPTPEGRGDGQRPVRQERKRAKRRTRNEGK